MAVTVTTNTLSATWTAAQFMTALETCFVNSGELSSAWYDSVVSGSNSYGIVRRTYDAGTYGTTDYGFRLEGTSELTVVAFREWNNGTSTPNGTEGRDFPGDWNQADAADYGDIDLHQQSSSNPISYSSNGAWNFSTSSDVVFTCFTSGVAGRTTFRWYLIQNGSNYMNFQIPNEPCIYNDSENQGFAEIYFAQPYIRSTYKRGISFMAMSWGFDRSYPGGYIRGQDVNTSTTQNQYHCHGMQIYSTVYPINGVSQNGDNSFINEGGIRHPITGNWGYGITDEFEPLILGGPYTQNHEILTLPNDFGVWAGHPGSTTLQPNDILQVSGSEEYTVIAPVKNGTSTVTRYIPAFVARTT
jgi:hypothetical protein